MSGLQQQQQHYRTLKFGDRTISYDAGIDSLQNNLQQQQQQQQLSVDEGQQQHRSEGGETTMNKV